MKKAGFSVWGVIVGIVVVVLICIGAYLVIDGNNKATDYSKYDFNSIIGPDAYNGNIGDHVKGYMDAPVLIFEYADYQCPACAAINTRVNQVIDDMDGKLAVVYRNFLLSYHQNGTAAASAAEAAGIQGYWKPYADKLFARQAEWEDLTSTERAEKFNEYFMEVSDGKGDIDKFNKDISSNEVSKKISFDMGISKRIDIPGTPAFYIDGQKISFNEPGSVNINGREISWEESQSGDKFNKLLKKIVNAKLGKDTGEEDSKDTKSQDKKADNKED